MSIHVVDLEKAYDRVHRKKLWGVLCDKKKLKALGSVATVLSQHSTKFFFVLTVACYWPSSHGIPAQTFVSVSAELNDR